MNNFFPFPVKTSFLSVPIPASAFLNGIPLGQQGCIGVRLYVNSLVLDTQAATARAANLRQVYFGDSIEQRQELLAGVFSPIIYCSDLEQVFVRCNGIANEVQVQVYTLADLEN